MMTTPAPTLLPTPAEVRARIVRVLAEIMERDVESVSQVNELRADLGMDSLHALEFLSCISHEFRIDLAVEDAFGISTLDEVVSLVSAQLKAQR
jgi:acyl carrier protein